MKVVAIVVSKMDRPLGPVLDSILPHVEQLVVVRGHGGVAERWNAAAAAGMTNAGSVLYTQDDDAIVDVPAVLAAYKPGVVTCNMPEDRRPEYQDGCALVGWGAIFDAKLVDTAFRRFWMYAHHHALMETWNDDVFRSEADRVFTGLSTLNLIDVPFEHCEAAHGKDRMGRRANHGDMRQKIRERLQLVRGEQ